MSKHKYGTQNIDFWSYEFKCAQARSAFKSLYLNWPVSCYAFIAINMVFFIPLKCTKLYSYRQQLSTLMCKWGGNFLKSSNIDKINLYKTETVFEDPCSNWSWLTTSRNLHKLRSYSYYRSNHPLLPLSSPSSPPAPTPPPTPLPPPPVPSPHPPILPPRVN